MTYFHLLKNKAQLLASGYTLNAGNNYFKDKFSCVLTPKMLGITVVTNEQVPSSNVILSYNYYNYTEWHIADWMCVISLPEAEFRSQYPELLV